MAIPYFHTAGAALQLARNGRRYSGSTAAIRDSNVEPV
jgi:hypothetical protein